MIPEEFSALYNGVNQITYMNSFTDFVDHVLFCGPSKE